MQVLARYLTKPDLVVSTHVNAPGAEYFVVSSGSTVAISPGHCFISGTNFFGSISRGMLDLRMLHYSKIYAVLLYLVNRKNL